MAFRVTGVGCSWCHELVLVDGETWPSCPSCGHRADVPRMLCDCARCQRGESVRLLPLDLADLAARRSTQIT